MVSVADTLTQMSAGGGRPAQLTSVRLPGRLPAHSAEEGYRPPCHQPSISLILARTQFGQGYEPSSATAEDESSAQPGSVRLPPCDSEA